MTITFRLTNLDWKQSISTSTHLLFFKRDWVCTIHRVTGKAYFRRSALKEMMRQEVEEGIE